MEPLNFVYMFDTAVNGLFKVYVRLGYTRKQIERIIKGHLTDALKDCVKYK